MRAAHPLERSKAWGFDGTWDKRFPEFATRSIADPRAALEDLDKLDAEDSLHNFIEIFWPVLEPARPLVPCKAMRAISEHLEAVNKGQIRKLLINVPPGFTKSLSTNVFFPAWEWGPRNRPDVRYVSFSYSQELTFRDNRRCRQLIEDPRYRRMWGDRFEIAPDQNAKGKYENNHRGFRIASSVGGVGTGERGDRIIVDDPHNLKEAESERVREGTLQWFTEVLPSRVNDPKTACFIVIMQRVHERDVSGLILAKETGYEHLCLPMEFESDHPHLGKSSVGFRDWRTQPGELLSPERFDQASVDALKQDLRAWGGSYAEAGQLQQRPSPRGGGTFKRSWWRFYSAEVKGYGAANRPNGCSDAPVEEKPTQFDEEVMSVDCAFKDNATGSRVSIMVVGRRGAKRYVLFNRTRHMTFTETVNSIVQIHGLFPRCRKVLVEDKANGTAVIDVLHSKIPGIIPVQPEGGKESRAAAIEPAVEAGQVLLPEGAPWLEDFLAEFASFPVGQYDDQVDTLTQVLTYMGTNAAVSRAIALGTW